MKKRTLKKRFMKIKSKKRRGGGCGPSSLNCGNGTPPNEGADDTGDGQTRELFDRNYARELGRPMSLEEENENMINYNRIFRFRQYPRLGTTPNELRLAWMNGDYRPDNDNDIEEDNENETQQDEE